ncbi:unnamed protein product [Scytosiphon promiscuus]
MFAVPRTADDLLLMEVQNESEKGVLRYLAAGAGINGSPQSGEEFPPIVMAAAVGSARMIKLLHEKGADINAGTWREASFPQYSRAVHVCVSSGYNGVLGALRQVIAAGADLNAKNAQGCTALMLACRVDKDVRNRLALAKELLEAGARTDPVDIDGRCALHYAAYSGNADLIKMLLSKGSLSTLNLPTDDLKTPLVVAVEFDHAEAVSVLLSAGASESNVRAVGAPCPFKTAVVKGQEEVLRVFTSERGLAAVGGAEEVIPESLPCAGMRGSSRILRMVLLAQGEERQQRWARHRCLPGLPLICMAAGSAILANVIVLLAAGAHELESDSQGRVARDMIGALVQSGEPDPREVAAIDRALQRGPAYRARSWMWQTNVGMTASGRATSALAPLNVAIVRHSDPQLLGRLLRRYSSKR